MKLHLITYGCGAKFDLTKFKPITNRNFVKPDGGLWASPVDSNYGWSDWCQVEDYGDLSTHFEFTFDGEVLIIDSLADAEQLPWLTVFGTIQYPDFETLAELYDAIWLTEKGQSATRLTQPNLYGWDCETVLIMNPDCIQNGGEK